MADVAEEVARFYGYDKIPVTLPNGEATTGKIPFKLRIEEVAEILQNCGFSEGMTYSFESPKVFDKLLFLKMQKSVRQSRSEPSGRRLQYHENNYLKRNVNFSGYKL